MARIHDSIVELIGNTPLLELGRYARRHDLQARLVGKVEYFNPVGSVKDRIAWAIIDDAERSGALQPGQLIVDITSGNTGIALAAIAAARGYRAKFYLGDNTSPDKEKIIRAFGAEVVSVPNSLFLDPEAIAQLFERVETENPGAFVANQLGNPVNPQKHYETTGPEIWRDTDGQVDFLVGGVGTGGTVSGAGKYLKEQNPDVQVIVIEPGESSLPSEENVYPHEIDGVHKVADIEAELLPENYDIAIADEIIPIEADAGWATARELAREEGLLIGSSAGAIVAAATIVAARPENAGKTVVAVLPDTGERYLSVGVFDEPTA